MHCREYSTDNQRPVISYCVFVVNLKLRSMFYTKFDLGLQANSHNIIVIIITMQA